MKIAEFFKKYGAIPIAAVIFIAIAVIYAWPEAVEGKVINAGDNVTAACAVHKLDEYHKATGDYSWWTDSMFSGMPSYQVGGGHYQSEPLLAPLKALLHKGHGSTPWVFIIYFFSFFILLRAFEVKRWTSIAGAIAMGLSSYFIIVIAAGHNGKTSTIALLSVVFGAFYLIFRRKKYGLGAILAMIFTAVGHATHPQMAYYIFMMIGVCWIAELITSIKEKGLAAFGIASLIFFASVGLGVATNMAGVFANSEYTGETMRGGHSDLAKDEDEENRTGGLDLDYATQWSYGRSETFSLLIPGFMGGASSHAVDVDSHIGKALTKNGVSRREAKSFCENVPLYWGDQPFTAGNVYVGAIVCFLFILGLFVVKGPYKWALLISTLFSIALAWGHNFMWLTRIFFNYFPLYNKFRAVSSILIVAEIAMPLLGFLALKELFGGGVQRKEGVKAIIWSAAITGGLCLFFFLFGSSLFDFKSVYDQHFTGSLPAWFYQALITERASLLRSDSLRSLLFIAAAAATLLLYTCGRFKEGIATAIIGVLVLADLWGVDKRYLNDNSFHTRSSHGTYFDVQPYEAEILADEALHFRVFNITGDPFSDARTSYRLNSLGGYSAAKLRRYQDLIDVYLKDGYKPVADMLNARWFITAGENGTPTPLFNQGAMGNAWFVENVIIADDANEEIRLLGEIDLRREAVTDASFKEFAKVRPPVSEESAVILTGYNPHSLDYLCTCDSDATIVFSEIYYPHGWKATIDGKPAEHFRANYTLRALNVPKGSHKIHFEFDPDSVKRGDRIAIAAIVLMYLISAGIIAGAIIKRRSKDGETAAC